MEMQRNEKEVRVSIIIATYNAGDFIGDCLDSIRRNATNDTEVVIIDGGSTDSTMQIVKDAGITNVLSQKDKGIYDAQNKGAKRAQGKWLYFMGADDSLLPGFRSMTEKLKDEDTIYYGNTRPVYATDKKVPYHLLTGRFDRYRLSKYPVNHQAVLYPAKVFSLYAYDIKYRVFADYALNLQLWGDRRFRICYVPIEIANYNMTGFSSSIRDEEFKKDKSALIRRHLGSAVWLRYIFKKFKKRLKGEDWY